MARMALTIVGQVVGTAVGSYFGYPQLGAVVGSMIGSTAGGFVDQALMGGGGKGIKSSDVAVQVSTYGHPINRVWGPMVVAGDLIWLSKRRKKEKQAGSKGGFGGGGTGSSYIVYRQDFMVGLSEPVCDVLKIWLDAKLVYDKTGPGTPKHRYSSLKIRFYYGGPNQQPDELIEAERGIGHVPGFRHLNAIMFDNLPLRDYGNRVPNVRALVSSHCADAENKSVVFIEDFPQHIRVQDSLLLDPRPDVPYAYFPMFRGASPGDYTSPGYLCGINGNTNTTEVQAAVTNYWGALGAPDIDTDGRIAWAGVHDGSFFEWHDKVGDLCRYRNQGADRTHIQQTIRLFATPSMSAGTPALRSQINWVNDCENFTCIRPTQQIPAGTFRWSMGGAFSLLWVWRNADLVNGEVWVMWNREGLSLDTQAYNNAPTINRTTFGAIGGFTSGQFRLRDVDTDDQGTAYILWSGPGQTQVYRIVPSIPEVVCGGAGALPPSDITLLPGTDADLSAQMPGAEIILYYPPDNSLIIGRTGASPGLLKWSLTDAEIVATLDITFQNNTQSFHNARRLRQDSLWIGSLALDLEHTAANGDHYFPQFTEISLATLTVLRTVVFHEAGPLYPPRNAIRFSPINALYSAEEDAIYAEGGQWTIGKFSFGSATDAVCPSLQTVVEEICLATKKLTLSQINASALADEQVCGFVNDNQRPARELLEILAGLYFFNGRERDGEIEFTKRTGLSLVSIPAIDLAAHQEGETVPVTLKEIRQQEIELPRDVQMLFFNPDRDYEQDSVQEIRNARVVESTERVTVNAPVVYTQGQAKRVCSILAREHWLNRATYETTLAPPYQRLDVLDAVTITLDDETTRFIRWTEINEGANGLLEMKGIDHHPEVYTDLPNVGGGSPGGGFTPPIIHPTVLTQLFLLDTPLLHDSDDGSIVYFAVTPVGPGSWGGTEVLRSIDQGVTWDEFSAHSVAATAGVAETVLAAPDAWTVWDEVSTVDVRLLHGELFNATALDVLNLANAALLGDEIMQFRTATLLSATAVSVPGPIPLSASQITLTWEQASEDEDGFHIFRSLLELSGFVQVGTVGANVLTFVDRGLLPDTTYYHKVTAFNAAGDSLYSNTTTHRTTAATPPPTPPSGGSGARYRLSGLLRGRRGTEWAIGTHQVNERFVLLEPGTVKRQPLPLSDFAVRRDYRAITSDMTIEDSTLEVLTWQARSLTPYAVAHARAVSDATDTIVVTWVRRSRVGVAWQSGADPAVAEASEAYEVDVLHNATRVRTFTTSVPTVTYTPAQQNADAVSTIDALVFAIYQMSAAVGRGFVTMVLPNAPSGLTILPPPPLPDVPTGLVVTVLDSTRIRITLDDPDAPTATSIQLDVAVGAGPFTLLTTLVAPDMALYDHTGLTPATLYSYRARAFNETGHSAYSATESDTTDAAPVAVPTAPSLLSVTTISPNRIDGTFTDNSNNELGCKLEMSTNGGAFVQVALLGANETIFSKTGLTASTLYAFRVRAYNSAGDSAYSNTDSDTTESITIPPPTTQHVFFVSTTGSNTNAGTITAPFKTVAKALATAKAGDTIYLRGGTYPEGIKSSTQTLWTGTSWSAPIVVSAYLAETVTMAPTSGYALLQLFGAAHRYYHFQNLILDGANVSHYVIALDGLNAAGAGFLRFTNCEIRNSPSSGVLLGNGSNFNEFLNCSIHNNGHTPAGGGTRAYGLYIQTSSNLVEGCEIFAHTGYGIHMYNGFSAQRASHNRILRNLVHGNCTSVDSTQSAGILLGSGDNNLAANNIVYDEPIGIMVGQPKTTNTKVYHNTCTDTVLYGVYLRPSSTGATVRNNILFDNGSSPLRNDGISTIQSNNLTTDPDFVDSGTRDYHLQAGSDAIGAGMSLPVVAVDFDGNSRPTGGLWDAGAFQYVV